METCNTQSAELVPPKWLTRLPSNTTLLTTRRLPNRRRLLEALQACEAEGDAAGRELWRRRIYDYLQRVFQVRLLFDRSRPADLSTLTMARYIKWQAAACPPGS